MKQLKSFILESEVLHDVLIEKVKRFNGCFREILTWLKHNGYGDITMHKEAKASSNGLHRMHLEFKPECKSNPEEVCDILKKKYSYAYDIWYMKAKPDDKDPEYHNATIWICDKVYK